MADQDSRSGSTYGSGPILDYCIAIHAQHDEAAQRAFDAPQKKGMPAIQVGPLEAKTLAMVLKVAQAKRVVEIGALAGYSAIQMARALPEGGRLWSIEVDPHYAEIAQANVRAAGLEDRIEIVVGKALDVLPQIENHGPFDAVFLDADKESYPQYGRWAARHLRKGGFLLADNVFLFGRLLDNDEPAAQAMRTFHKESARAFDTVCLPTPDGLLWGVRW